jgi:septum formation protein
LLVKNLKKNELLITSDTIVWHNDKALGKPKNRTEAFKMIKSLENSSHEVITSICISTLSFQVIVNEKTLVYFDSIDENDLLYYTKTHDVLDRAGGYGIQDYIGHIGIKKIEGSYSNVLGFPTNLFVKTINSMNL